MKRIAWQTITLTLVLAGTALASTSGTPLDTVSTRVMTLVSGPIALLLIIADFAGAGIIYFMGRNFEVAFLTLAGLAVGGVLCPRFKAWRPICSRWLAPSSGKAHESLALTRPKLKRGAEWKLIAVNGLFTILLVVTALVSSVWWTLVVAALFLLAGTMAITPGRQARSELAGRLSPIAGAPRSDRASRRRQRGRSDSRHLARRWMELCAASAAHGR